MNRSIDEYSYTLKDKRFEGSYSSAVFSSLFYAFRPYRLVLFILMALGLAGRICLLMVSWVIGVWADSLVVSGSPVSLSGSVHRMHDKVPEFFSSFGNLDFLTLAACLAFASFVLNLVYRVPLTRTGALGVSRLYDAVTYRTSRLPLSFFDRTPVGRIVSRFSSDYGSVLRMAGGPLGEFIVIVFDLLLLVSFIVITSFAFAPIVLLTIFVNFLVYRRSRYRLRDSRRNMSLTRGPAIAHFAETTQGHSTIRLFGKSKSFEERFGFLRGEYLRSRLSAVQVIQRFAFEMNFFTAVLLLLAGIIGLYLYSEGLLSVGRLAVMFTFVSMMSSTTQQFFDYLGRFDEALTGIERLGEYLSLELEPGAEQVPGAEQLPTVLGVQNPIERADFSLRQENCAVLISGLTMRYAGAPEYASQKVLSDLSLQIQAGEKFGVIGRTGSGKSSLINALMYLYPFESGFVAVNAKVPAGILPKDILKRYSGCIVETELESYRRQMALIAQEPVLFRGTLRDNLAIAGKSISDAEMIGALESVGLADWVSSLARSHKGLLSLPIAEAGANLSAGQRQLVCLARALLENASVVVMDEATSFVDPRSEQKIIGATKEFLRSKTQIIVAHRLSTLEDCDRVLWLDSAGVRELGPAQEVLGRFRRNSLY